MKMIMSVIILLGVLSIMAKGFSKTFGLIQVDRITQTRYPKESLRILGSYSRKY